MGQRAAKTVTQKETDSCPSQLLDLGIYSKEYAVPQRQPSSSAGLLCSALLISDSWHSPLQNYP